MRSHSTKRMVGIINPDGGELPLLHGMVETLLCADGFEVVPKSEEGNCSDSRSG